MKTWNNRPFLFINGELYRKLQTNKSQDIYRAQNTQTKKIQTFSYRVVRDTHEVAYTTKDVGELLGRAAVTIRKEARLGNVTPVRQSYNQDDHGRGRCEYYFRPEDIHELRDWFATRPRAYNNKRAVPTKAELSAMLTQSVVLYVKAKDGSFIPTWKA